jgi:hypothetical protein
LLFYTNQLPFAKAIPNRQGIVNTVGVEGSIHFKAKREKFMAEGMLQGDAGKHPYPGATDRTWIGSDYGVANADGLFTQEDGTVSRVIHQFDRYGVGYTIWLGQQPFVKDPLPDGAAALLPHVKPPHGAPPDAIRRVTDAGVDVSDPSLFETVDLQGDSSTATVMGMASGYNLGIYKRFVGSLRKSGFKGHIILGVAPDVASNVLDYFEYRGVTPKILKWVNCTYASDGQEKLDIFKRTTCSDPYPDIKIRWSRFPLQRDWLRDCETCTGPVLIMDVRDSYFQLDPFGPGSGPIKGLQVFEEHPSQTTGHWLVKNIVEQCKDTSFIKPMLCSGTTIGTRAAMLKYLEAMYEEMKVWITTSKCRFNLNGDVSLSRGTHAATDCLCFFGSFLLTIMPTSSSVGPNNSQLFVLYGTTTIRHGHSESHGHCEYGWRTRSTDVARQALAPGKGRRVGRKPGGAAKISRRQWNNMDWHRIQCDRRLRLFHPIRRGEIACHPPV